MAVNFADRLTAAVREKRTAAVVGIDPVLERLPAALRPKGGDLQSAAAAMEALLPGCDRRSWAAHPGD